MRGFNGGILGKTNNSSSEIASGIWSGTAVELAKRNNSWPNILSNTALRLDFDQTTTLPAGISFTRATSGTFFNSAGVLTTAGSGAARFDHRLEGGIWKNKGLLIEEQRTNLHIRSEEINDAAWVKENLTVSANATQAPDGTTTADTVTETTANASHRFYRNGGFTATSNTPVTFSVFLKANGSSSVLVTIQDVTFSNFGVYVNLSTGVNSVFSTPTSYNVTDVGNGWYRVDVTINTGGSSGTYYGIVWTTNGYGGTTNFTGSTSNSIYAWGAQLEAGSFPTSYIRTTDASVTRNADVASMTSTNFSSWYNQSEGTVFAQASTFGNPVAITTRFWEVSDGTSNKRFILSSVSNISPAGAIRYAVIDSGVDVSIIDTSFAMAANQTYKTAICYKVNDFAYSVDGSLIGTDTSGTLPTVDKIGFGVNFANNGAFLNGHIAKFYYWNTRKPNEFLQSITG